MLAGIAVPIILQPFQGLVMRYYTARQLLVMNARDSKAHVVEEALHGIRQIKFSAIEAQWQKLILAARERELRAQWNVYTCAIFLTFCWLAMPIMIGAAAISVYAWLSQNMKASVAFTALAVFSSLEWTINTIPPTITEMIDARVSIQRIQEHLDSEEKISAIKQGDHVSFEAATVAWPSRSHSSTFTLRDLDLSFPLSSLRLVNFTYYRMSSIAILTYLTASSTVKLAAARACYSTPSSGKPMFLVARSGRHSQCRCLCVKVTSRTGPSPQHSLMSVRFPGSKMLQSSLPFYMVYHITLRGISKSCTLVLW